MLYNKHFIKTEWQFEILQNDLLMLHQPHPPCPGKPLKLFWLHFAPVQPCTFPNPARLFWLQAPPPLHSWTWPKPSWLFWLHLPPEQLWIFPKFPYGLENWGDLLAILPSTDVSGTGLLPTQISRQRRRMLGFIFGVCLAAEQEILRIGLLFWVYIVNYLGEGVGYLGCFVKGHNLTPRSINTSWLSI